MCGAHTQREYTAEVIITHIQKAGIVKRIDGIEARIYSFCLRADSRQPTYFNRKEHS